MSLNEMVVVINLNEVVLGIPASVLLYLLPTSTGRHHLLSFSDMLQAYRRYFMKSKPKNVLFASKWHHYSFFDNVYNIGA